MPYPDPTFDLSTLETWNGLRPGMTRAEAMTVLDEAGIEVPEKDIEKDDLFISDWGMELSFDEEGEQVLRQISLEEEEVYWSGTRIGGRPFHEVLSIMGAAAGGAGWRSEDATLYVMLDLGPPKSGAYTDEIMLREGTLWLPNRSLGLVLYDGSVGDIVWRQPQDVPTQLLPLTDAQRQLSSRPDLREYLKEQEGKQPQVKAAPKPWQPVRRALTMLLIASLVFITWLGWRETERLRTAPILPGKVLSFETLPENKGQKTYRIGFNDPAGNEQVAILEWWEFDIAPREVGEAVQVCYVRDDPPRVMGIYHKRDSGFTRYMPWAFAAMGLYFVALLLMSILTCLFAKKKSAIDPDRPQLR